LVQIALRAGGSGEVHCECQSNDTPFLLHSLLRVVEGVNHLTMHTLSDNIVNVRSSHSLCLRRELMPRAFNKTQRKGRLSKTEKEALEALARIDPTVPAEKVAEKLAPLLRRSEGAVKDAVIEARQRVHERAIRYADAHIESVEGALAEGQFDVAARHAWQAIERLNIEGESVLAPKQMEQPQAQGPVVTINMPVLMGGAKPQISSEIVDSE